MGWMNDFWHWWDTDRLSALTAALSAIAAFFAWKATLRANDTANSVAHIEHARWQMDLEPQLRITITKLGPSTGSASLQIQLVGPTALEQLDRVTIKILDDGYTYLASSVGRPTQADLDATIWGPYRFGPTGNGSPASGRSTSTFSLQLGKWAKHTLEASRRPDWWDDHDAVNRWDARYTDAPVLLWIECERDGFKPWKLYRELHAVDPTRADASAS